MLPRRFEELLVDALHRLGRLRQGLLALGREADGDGPRVLGMASPLHELLLLQRPHHLRGGHGIHARQLGHLVLLHAATAPDPVDRPQHDRLRMRQPPRLQRAANGTLPRVAAPPQREPRAVSRKVQLLRRLRHFPIASRHRADSKRAYATQATPRTTMARMSAKAPTRSIDDVSSGMPWLSGSSPRRNVAMLP